VTSDNGPKIALHLQGVACSNHVRPTTMSRKLKSFPDFLVDRFDYPIENPIFYSSRTPLRRPSRPGATSLSVQAGRPGSWRTLWIKHSRRQPNPDSQRRMGLEPLMDVAELASYLGLPLSTVCDWRVRGKGSVACRFGKHPKFAVSDVRAWVTRYRDWDCRARQVQATGATARAASGR
jgi:hypothetical protein